MNTDKIIAEAIAKDYAPINNYRLIALKKLDKKAKRPAIHFAYAYGIVSVFAFLIGICLATRGIDNRLVAMIIGIIGFIGCGINYPIYQKVLQKCKAKYAFEIVEIARQICEQ